MIAELSCGPLNSEAISAVFRMMTESLVVCMAHIPALVFIYDCILLVRNACCFNFSVVSCDLLRSDIVGA